MAEGNPFEALKAQVTCPVCLEVYHQPKLLSCNHPLCSECIDKLVEKGEESIKCPSCREVTLLPKVGSLPTAFLINALIDCHKSTKRYSLLPNTGVESYCSEHMRPMEMFCDDCDDLVCTKCYHVSHRDHLCSFVTDVVGRHKQQLRSHLEAIKLQVSVVLNALENLVMQEQSITKKGESLKQEIDCLTQEIVETVQESSKKLKETVDNSVSQKIDRICRQQKDIEIFHTHLKSCVRYVNDKLQNGSEQEIVLETGKIIEQMQAVTKELTEEDLELKESLGLYFQQSRGILKKCSKIGKVCIDGVPDARYFSRQLSIRDKASSDDSYAEFCATPRAEPNSHIVAILGKPRHIVVAVNNFKLFKPVKLSCRLISLNVGASSLACSIHHVDENQFSIYFTPTHEGMSRVEIKTNRTNVRCDPAYVMVIPSLKVRRQQSSTVKLSGAMGVACVADDMVLVTGCSSGGDITLVNGEGAIVHHFPHEGGSCPRGTCVTPDGHILVVSDNAPYITRYTLEDFALVDTVGGVCGNQAMQFYNPSGIAVNPSGQIFVSDTDNNRIQVLHSDLTFSHSLKGVFNKPQGIAIDSHNMLYVCDQSSKILKVSCKDENVECFRMITSPRWIAIDSNDIVYVTTSSDLFVCDTDGEIIDSIRLGNKDVQGVAVMLRRIFVCDCNGTMIIL